MSSRNSIDNIFPATMLVSMIGFVVGLAGMALLGFGSLSFIKLLIDSILVLIPNMVTEKNPWDDLTTMFSLRKIMFHAGFVIAGTFLRRISGFLCSPITLKKIENFFYNSN
jgi:hypothetical protein